MPVQVRRTTQFRRILDHFLQNLPEAQRAQVEQLRLRLQQQQVATTQGSKAAAGGKTRTAKGKKGAAAIPTSTPTGPKITWDGEEVQLDQSVADVEDLEDGELLDVVW